MICTDCGEHFDLWTDMKSHYKRRHPSVKNFGSFFKREAKK